MANFKNRIIGYGEEPIDQILFNPANWRIHPKAQQDALTGVLEEVGWVQNVIVNKRTGHLVDGHLRVQLADRAGEKTIPVTYVDLSESEEMTVLATIDPIAAMAATDKEKLDDVLRQVHADDARIQQAIADLAAKEGLYQTNEGKDTEPQIDKAEELRVKWGVELGQLWQLGDHRIICGDCTDNDTVNKIKDIFLNICVTDPPYGVEYDANWRNEAADKGLLSYADRRIGKVMNDSRDNWEEAWKLFDGDVIYCWHADRRASSVQNSLENAGFEMRAQIIWEKPHFVIGRGHYTPRHEPCWYCIRKSKTASWIGENLQTTMWKISLDKNVNGGHSTQKPLECMQRPISNHSGDVYEPFSGSGTTIIACENLGRKCRAIEIDPGYVAVALERWHQHTGKTPVLIA